MGVLTHKTTILFAPEEHRLLVQEARRQGSTMGDLIRRAVRKLYFSPPQAKNKKAWDKLLKMKAPVGDWEKMEKEILRGRLES